jgi:repressor LexA
LLSYVLSDREQNARCLFGISFILRTKVVVAMKKLGLHPIDDDPHDPQGPQPVGELLRARREALRMSLQRVADELGCTKSYLCEVELCKRGVPSDEVIEKLERVLMVPKDEWVRAASWERSLRAGGKLVREELRAAFSQRTAGDVVQSLRALVPSQEVGASDGAQARGSRSPRSDVLALPVDGGVGLDIPIINKVPAGKATEFTDLGYPARAADAFMRCPGVTDPDAFAARVIGDSMEPTYLEGDVVVFSPLVIVQDGSDCFARLEPDSECTFKRVYFEDAGASIRLQPLNAKYQSRVVTREEVAGLYVAVRVLREVRRG